MYFDFELDDDGHPMVVEAETNDELLSRWLMFSEIKGVSFSTEESSGPAPRIEEHVWELLVTLPQLRCLYLKGYVTRPLLPSIRLLHQLNAIELAEANLEGDDLEFLSDFKQLRSLDLSGNPVGETGLRHLQGLLSLRELCLDRTGTTDHSLAHVVSLPCLERLSLQFCDISDEGVAQLSQRTKLRALDLLGNRVTDVSVEYLARMKSLQFLNLRGTEISFDGGVLLKDALPNTDFHGSVSESDVITRRGGTDGGL